MADGKIKKFKGNVTSKLFSSLYHKYVILTWETACNSSNFIYIYDFSEIIVKYEFSQYIDRYDVTMTSHYVMVTKKLYLDARNNDYIVLCKSISGCRVTGVRPPEPPSPPPPPPPTQVMGSKQKPGLNRVNVLNGLQIKSSL